jgi:hypothetical protein
VLDQTLGNDRRHELVGVVHALPAREPEREGKRVGKVVG